MMRIRWEEWDTNIMGIMGVLVLIHYYSNWYYPILSKNRILSNTHITNNQWIN